MRCHLSPTPIGCATLSAFHYIAFHYIELHYALHLHYITLHCNVTLHRLTFNVTLQRSLLYIALLLTLHLHYITSQRSLLSITSPYFYVTLYVVLLCYTATYTSLTFSWRYTVQCSQNINAHSTVTIRYTALHWGELCYIAVLHCS